MKTANDNLISLPNKRLREPSRKVGLISKEILDIVEKMKEKTLEWEDSRKYEVGVALAAIQIDKPYRIIIVRDDFDSKDNRSFTVFINPTITKYEGKIVEDYEGCLSVTDIYGRVPRYEKVRVKATGLNGKEFRLTATGFLARVLQHEIDHVNGKLFIDHIKDNPAAFYKLDSNGQLEELNYEKQIKQSSILW